MSLNCSCPMNCQLHQPKQFSKFTDEDLKRLKENMIQRGRSEVYLKRFDLEALLTRLEAAEVCIQAQVDQIIPNTLEYEVYERWRKAAGK